MSSISTRPRVQKINGPVLTTLTAVGVVLAAKALRDLFGTAAPKMDQPSGAVRSEEGLQPLTALKKAFAAHRQQAFEQAQTKLPEVEALRTATFAAIESTPFHLENSSTFQAHCCAVQTAATPAELLKAERALLDTLAVGHQQVFMNTLGTACRHAAARLGFDRVEVVRLTNQVRVVASDPAGRSLVSEIEPDMHGDAGVATEVVGVLDGSCQPLLDDFDRALEEEGVRSGPAERKFTGGVCELASARAIARELWKPLSATRSSARAAATATTAKRLRANRPSALPSKE